MESIFFNIFDIIQNLILNRNPKILRRDYMMLLYF